MLDLKDFFHLPEVDVLLTQVVNDPRGITIVAGPGLRLGSAGGANPDRSAAPVTDRSTIAALIMRHILDRAPNGRRTHASIVGPRRSLLPVANHQRAQVEFVAAPLDHIDGFTTGLQQAMMRDPDLLAVDRLTTVTAPATFHAAATGRRILTQIDTALVGGEVLQEIVGLGCSPSQMSLVAWVIAVQHVPTLCTHCKQPHRPGAALVGVMAERHSLDPQATFYAAAGCGQCGGTGYVGELTVFDIFRVHGGVASFAELVSTPSLLPLEGYLSRLAAAGYLPLEDAVRLGGAASHAASAAAEGAASPDPAARSLQRRLAELEAANKVLAQRVDALISLQEESQALAASTRLDALAERVAHAACELSGADHAALYAMRASGEARVLAVAGWGREAAGRAVRLPDAMRERGDPDPFAGPPPGVELAGEPAPSIQAGVRLPLVVDEALVGVLIVQSLVKSRFTPGEVALLRALSEQAAVSLRRAREVESLHDKIAYLEASRTGLVERARLDRELELARALQVESLPRQFPAVDGLQFAAAYRPVREVGADAYDVIDLGRGRLALFVADVAGRGLAAAYNMGQARALIHAETRRGSSPREALAGLNRALRDTARGAVMLTVFLGLYEVETRHLIFCRAGHVRPLWLRADGRDVLLGAPGMPVGMFDPDEIDLAEGEIFLSPGDALILYTDGLIDALDPYGSEFGAEHWVRLAREHAGLPADRLCQALFDEVAAFQAGAPQVDDMALLVMKVLAAE